jgi:AcrR family transcriptional regulator
LFGTLFVQRTVLYTHAVSPSSPRKQTNAKAAEAASAASAAMPPPPRLPRRREPPSRRTALTVDGIVAAAIEVLDEQGVAGLSMRRVAERLGTGAASLYAHISGKDELLELVFDELVGQVPLVEPDPKRWREQIYQIFRDLYDVLASHRDAALVGLGRIPTSPKTMVATEVLVATMRAGGLSDRATGLGLDLLTLFVSASAFEAGLYEQSTASPEELQRYFDDVHAFYDRLPTDRFPMLASIASDMTDADGEERFKFGIDVIIAGLEAISSQDRRGSRRPRG